MRKIATSWGGVGGWLFGWGRQILNQSRNGVRTRSGHLSSIKEGGVTDWGGEEGMEIQVPGTDNLLGSRG